MRVEQVRTILKREYLTRIKSKAFWITTLLLPLGMAALVVVPSLIAMRAKASHRLAIVDRTGTVGVELERRLTAGLSTSAREDPFRNRETQVANFAVELAAAAPDAEAQRADLDRRVLAGEIDAWLWIDQAGLDKDQVEYHAESVSNFITQSRVEEVVSRVVGEARLKQAGIDAGEVERLTRGIEIETTRVLAEGSRKEGGLAGFFLAYFLFFLLYMVVMLYGQQVMNGVLEEKSSRIVEVILSTVNPSELMVGKLLGIGLIGLTQLAIWLGTMVALSTPAVLGALAMLPDGTQLPQVTLGLAIHFFVNFLLGFFVFASLYAAIGAATNNVQEAQQLAGFLVIFLIAPVLFVVPVINDPDSTLAVVLSLIPMFTPLLMMLRIAVKMPPLWQILAGYAITATFLAFLVWGCARIYRVGILMYGKKPTLAELWRWVRHA